MLSVLRAFALASSDAVRPRMLAIVLLPGLAALLLWSVLGWIYWDVWTGWVSDLIAATSLARWMDAWSGWHWIVVSASVILMVAFVIPAVFITAVVITELLAMPVIVAFVARQHYPALEEKAGGTWYGSLINTVTGTGQFVLLWLVTLPLWLTGIGAVLLPVLISAYLNQRLFGYEALAEHASAGEYRALRQRAGGRLFVLGILLALIYYVPLLNLLAPVLTGLAFTHMGLAELERLRAEATGVRSAPL